MRQRQSVVQSLSGWLRPRFMFRLTRNIHRGLGLACFMMAMMFVASSVFVIYRPLFSKRVTEGEWTDRVATSATGTPRLVALEVMRAHHLKGGVLGVAELDEGFSFRIVRPGTEHRVDYSTISGDTTIRDRQYPLGQTLLQLHDTHVLWHEFVPAGVWSALSLLTSIGLLLLGASGIYLWYTERVIGGILLIGGVGFCLTTLVLTLLASQQPSRWLFDRRSSPADRLAEDR